MVKKLLTIGFVIMVWSLLGIAQSAPQAQSGSAPNARMQAEAGEWQRMHDLGLKYKTAWELYMALKTEAGGGKVSPAFSELPDWTGLWERAPRGDVSMVGPGPGGVMPKFTPGALAQLKAHAELTARGAAYQDNISDCGPPGYPSWLDIPFMREFIVRPEETWLSSETVNNVRRIYTDGRDHPPTADRYPLYYGDSIGFWDHQKLVIHTNQLMGRSLGGFADELHHSEQMETVEIWDKVAPNLVEDEVWLYDPATYLEPWFVIRHYTQVPNPNKEFRMNYWNCNENQNNEVIKTPDGNTAFKDLTFTHESKDEPKQ